MFRIDNISTTLALILSPTLFKSDPRSGISNYIHINKNIFDLFSLIFFLMSQNFIKENKSVIFATGQNQNEKK